MHIFKLGKQISEYEANLIYRVSSGKLGHTENLCLKSTK